MHTVVRENQCSKFSPICYCTENVFSFLKQDYVIKRLRNTGVCQLPCEILSKPTGWFWRKFRKAVYDVFLLCSVPHSIFLWLGMEQWLWPVTDESMLSFYQTPENISSFWSKNSWLGWKRDLYFQRPSNDMWDTRKQEKFLDVRLRNRHQPEFRIGDSCPQTKGEEKSSGGLAVYSQDKQEYQATFFTLGVCHN